MMAPDNSFDARELYDIYRTTGMGTQMVSPNQKRGRVAHLSHNIMPFIPGDHSLVIADIACGSGDLLEVLKRVGYLNVMGVDLSAEQVGQVAARGLDCVELGDAFDFLDVRTGKLDVVIAIDFLEHLRESEVLRLLELVHKALSPGGRLIVQTCNAKSPFFGNYRYGDFTHQLAFTADSLRQVLLANGFTQIVIREVRPGSQTLRGYARRMLWHVVRLPLVAYLAVETGIIRGHILSQNLIAVADKV